MSLKLDFGGNEVADPNRPLLVLKWTTVALRPGGGEQGDRRSIMQLGAPIGQYRYSHGGASGEKWDFFVIFGIVLIFLEDLCQN